MSKIYQIFQQLRALPVEGDLQRESRAMFVAQLMAYQPTIDTVATCEAMIEKATPEFRKFLSDLNEYIAIDTRLAQTFFEGLIKARYEVATVITDPTLMHFILTSDTQETHLNADSKALMTELLKNREYGKTQRNISELLKADTAVSVDE